MKWQKIYYKVYLQFAIDKRVTKCLYLALDNHQSDKMRPCLGDKIDNLKLY
jgi:hypothetical protein